MNPDSPIPQYQEFDQYLPELYNPTESVVTIDDLFAWFQNYDLMENQTIPNGTQHFSNNQNQLQAPIWDYQSRNPEGFNYPLVDSYAEAMSTSDPTPFSCASGGIFYEENPLPDYALGSSEVIPSIMDDTENFSWQTNIEWSPLQSPPPLKKTPKVKSVRKTSNLPHINVDEWLIMDEASGRKRRPWLHEFLRLLLENSKYSHVASYVDRYHGIFKFHDRKTAAQLWQRVKGRNSETNMTYEKLARAIRYYYNSKIMRQTPGRFTFRFGEASGFGNTWTPV